MAVVPKAWVVGLVNVRGNLLPMMDLQLFFGAEPVARSKAARLLDPSVQRLEPRVELLVQHRLRRRSRRAQGLRSAVVGSVSGDSLDLLGGGP